MNNNINDNNDLLNELHDKEHDLYMQLNEVQTRIHMLESENAIPDYVGKYIKIDDWGYIYVMVQKIDRDYAKPMVWLQGFYFNSSVSPYTDDFYFESDALKDLNIPVNMFEDYIRDGKVEEMTREAFMSLFMEKLNRYKDNTYSMLNHCENVYKEMENVYKKMENNKN